MLFASVRSTLILGQRSLIVLFALTRSGGQDVRAPLR